MSAPCQRIGYGHGLRSRARGLPGAVSAPPRPPPPPFGPRSLCWGRAIFLLHGSDRTRTRGGGPAPAGRSRDVAESAVSPYILVSSGPWTSARARSLRISLADAARKTDLARPRCCADDPGRTGRAGPSPPIRRKIRRFAASICLPRAARQQPSGSATRRRAGRFVPLRKERNRSFRFRPSVPSLRNGRCYSGLKDPARPSAARTVSTPFGSRNVRLAGCHGRPAKRAVVQIQNFLFRVETKGFLVSSALRIIADRDQVFVDHSPAPLRGSRRSQAAASHPHSRAPSCPASVFTSRISLLNGWSGGCLRSIPVLARSRWPATNPHAARTGFSALPFSAPGPLDSAHLSTVTLFA